MRQELHFSEKIDSFSHHVGFQFSEGTLFHIKTLLFLTFRRILEELRIEFRKSTLRFAFLSYQEESYQNKENENIKYFISSSGSHTHNLSHLQSSIFYKTKIEIKLYPATIKFFFSTSRSHVFLVSKIKSASRCVPYTTHKVSRGNLVLRNSVRSAESE